MKIKDLMKYLMMDERKVLNQLKNPFYVSLNYMLYYFPKNNYYHAKTSFIAKGFLFGEVRLNAVGRHAFIDRLGCT